MTLTIKPESIKTFLNQQLTERTKQKSEIEGDINWQIFPRPAIKITKIHLGDPQKATYTLDIDELLLNLQLSPLLRGQLIFSEIYIDGFRVNLYPEHKKASLAVPEKHSPSKLKQPTPTSSATKINGKLAANFAIDSFLLSRGELRVIDSKQPITLSDLQIGITRFNLEKIFFPIQLKGTLSGKIADYSLNSAFNFKGKTRLGADTLAHPELAIQDMNLDGQLLVQDLIIDQFKIDKINASTSLQAGQLELNPLNLVLYQGESIGNLNYQFASQNVSLNQTATGLNTNKLVKDVLGKNLVRGNLDVSLHAVSSLKQASWQQGISSKGSITIKEGALLFIDLDKLINDLTSKISFLVKQGKVDANVMSTLTDISTDDYQKGQTKFELLSIKYDLDHSMKLNNSILLQTSRFQLNGNGYVNLENHSIDNNLFLKFTTSAKMINQAQELFENGVPLKLSGELTKPLVYPDIKTISIQLSRFLLKKTLTKPIHQLKNELKDELKAFFK